MLFGAALGVACTPARAPSTSTSSRSSASKTSLGTSVACANGYGPPRDTPPSRAGAHPVVVAIVIDQLGATVADTKWPALSDTGGFARLRCEGTWLTTMRYAHAVTDTAPGHSALFTGSVPRDSGIFANEVLDDHDAPVSILRDAATKTLAPSGPSDAAASSIAALHVPTVADLLREAHPQATIVGLSLKDRGAIFGCGRHPSACLWLGKGEMVGSSAFGDAYPAWAAPLGDATHVATWTDFVWRPEDEAWLRAHAETPDAQRGEGSFVGLGATFPHDLSATHGAAIRISPKTDEGLLDLALGALAAEARPGEPVFLALSLSVNDYVGHVFGPGSWEAWEEMRRLDGALGRFFTRLDELFGPDWSVVLSGDHGVTPLPELAPEGTAGRIDPNALAGHLREAATRAGFPRAVRGVADPYVVLGTEARAMPTDQRRTLDAALATALAKEPGVSHVYFARDLDRPCPEVPMTASAIEADDEAALVCRSYSRGAGDVYVVPRPGWFFDTLYVPGQGTSHGTPRLSDRTVPLLVRAPGRVAAGVVIREPRTFATFARTLTDLLEIAPPEAARGAPSLVSRARAAPQ